MLGKQPQTHGFTLIEVLFALFILAFALLALAYLQLQSLQSANDTMMQEIAQQQLRNMAERLYVESNQAPALMKTWNRENARLLPKGEGVLKHMGNKTKLVLHWQSPHAVQESCTKLEIQSFK